MILTFLDKYRNVGLLILRIGLGFMFVVHGTPKIFGGPEMWAKIGTMGMAPLGIHFAPAVWGFLCALAEFGGGICVMLGIFFRPVCMVILIDMIVAAHMHLALGQGFGTASHAIEDGIVFLSLILIGPGSISLDALLTGFSGDKKKAP